MKCIWLGQAGLLFDFDGTTVMVDPYLSDSVAAVNPRNKRRVPVDESFFEIKPDVLLLTHDHLDHTDPETIKEFLGRYQGITVLASQNAWTIAKEYQNGHNYVLFDAGTEWTQDAIHFRAVHARHSDPHAIGALITEGEKTWYVTGDTLYCSDIIEEVKKTGKQLEAVFVPINGVGNNMNKTDAFRFAGAVGAKKTVPPHFGLFDAINPEEFVSENKIIPQIYREIPL